MRETLHGRLDFGVALAAAAKDGHALRYAREQLKDDRQFVLCAWCMLARYGISKSKSPSVRMDAVEMP